MKKYDYLIIGGGIAGTTAAETIREKDPNSSIAIFGDEPYPLYSRVLLPNYLKNKIELEKVFLRTKEDYDKKKIDTFFGEVVSKIDFEKKEIFANESHEVGYSKLLIASGGKVKDISFDGIPSEDIFYFQTFDDTKKIKERMKTAKNVVIAGGSFIALELLESFFINNINVTLLVRGQGFWNETFDKESNGILLSNFKEKGVNVVFEEEISNGKEKDSKKYIVTKKGTEYEYDTLCLGVGIERNMDFISASGIKMNAGVITDEHLRTNIENVYSAGDVAEFYDIFTEKHHIAGNWALAFLQGKVAGLNMTGGDEILKTASGYNIVNFGINISFIGDVSKDETIEVLKRGDSSKKEHSQLFLKNNLLVGATQINMNKDKGVLAMLMDKKIDLKDYKDKISDINFDLKSILNN